MYQNQGYKKPVERKGANRPEAVYQMDGADVAVWKNTRRKEDNEMEVFYKVTVNGTYADREGRRRFTQGVVLEDIPAAIKGLQQAYEKYHSIDDKMAAHKGDERKSKGLEEKV